MAFVEKKKRPRPPDVVKRKPRSQTVVCRQFGYFVLNVVGYRAGLIQSDYSEIWERKSSPTDNNILSCAKFGIGVVVAV